MSKKRKNQKFKAQFFIWLLSQRGTIYQADGRSNTINVGRHSLGTSIYQEAMLMNLIAERNNLYLSWKVVNITKQTYRVPFSQVG